MKWNVKSVSGAVMIVIGVWGLISWGGLAGLFSYLIALVMLRFGYKLWVEADSTLKKICSGLVIAAGVGLMLYWLPMLLNMVIAAALIYFGWRLLRSGQSHSNIYRY
ncbi:MULTISPECIES: hypothetical protein [unclassified Paenibacillus]|uniref:hypothetical protein n=1 Tax=unclassified Paenibacillus TaxID=185978 RepID=UPI001AE752B2|nr:MULTISPECIES: hypothetical protein [unclassified Paenibacillus]MBP1155911.1 putative membrane protein [Paenibacillus sp. PvP091]MBP1168703.1 putative membrane protein [Paenibacillus sp. PvR098]MBP2439731.1 putative membrane protein [Paenibacillus sp. PvP052]